MQNVRSDIENFTQAMLSAWNRLVSVGNVLYGLPETSSLPVGLQLMGRRTGVIVP